MAAITNGDIRVDRTPLQVVDRRPGARQELPPDARTTSSPGITLTQYHPEFGNIIGGDPRHALLLSSAESSRNPFFHGGCALIPESSPPSGSSRGEATGEEEVLYVTSNLLQTTSASQLPVILISRIVLHRDASDHISAVDWAKLRPPPIMPMPAGALPYAGRGGTSKGGVLFCAQGSAAPGSSGLFFMPRGKPPEALVTSYYGRDFNSVHDVAQAPDGALWFTDPCRGFEQDFRKKPQLPCQVYRFDPESSSLRVMDDSLARPTGICFAPDGQTVYVSNTDSVRGDGNQDLTRGATIYAFDAIRRGGSDFLANRRVFSFALRGVPLSIRCDRRGNVYAGCADGVEVWDAGGVLLGLIEVPEGGVSSFCFLREGEMLLCSEQRLWWLHTKPWVDVPNCTAMAAQSPGDNFI